MPQLKNLGIKIAHKIVLRIGLGNVGKGPGLSHEASCNNRFLLNSISFPVEKN